MIQNRSVNLQHTVHKALVWGIVKQIGTIAFIHPNQSALVKFTAYDYSIYGGLEGKVTIISPDTIRDEVKQDQFYYRVYIQTDRDQLENKAGQKFARTSGMITTVDIRNGEKTILDYLLKPFNKAKEALRAR